jgi:hypothetical protein
MKALPVRGPVVFRSLEDFHVWPLKHRHWNFELAEDEDHDLWIRTSDLRHFYDRFPSDKALKAVYHRHMLYDKSTRTHYLSVRSARIELLKSKTHSMHQDILKFLDWLERNVLTVVAKKRAVRKLDEMNGVREDYAKALSGAIPVSQAHPRLDETTMPLTSEERWALEQAQDLEGPRKVFHPDARPIRVGWDYFAREAWLWIKNFVRSYWRGERGLFKTFWAGLLVLWLPYLYFSWMLPGTLDWTVSYQRVMWAFAILVPVSVASALVYWIMLTRGLRQALRDRSHVVIAWVFYLFVFPLGLSNIVGGYDEEMLDYWWASVRGQYHAMTIYADPHLGRIRAVGRMGFGSAEALQQVLDANPKITLIELESPGGYVVEGMRMANMVEQRKLDTTVLGRCASSCTFVFVTGQDRYLGTNAWLGFHRSGRRNIFLDEGWSTTDREIAEHYEKYGTSVAFVQKALKEPMYRIWVAPHDEMYTAGYANKAWSERKAGY